MVGRRTMLQGLAALVAGGRQAAAAVEREVAGAVAGTGLGVAIGGGDTSVLQQPMVSNSDWYRSPAAILQSMRRWERESQRVHGYMDPWIVTMRSVPPATKARWMREIRMREQEEEASFLSTVGAAVNNAVQRVVGGD